MASLHHARPDSASLPAPDAHNADIVYAQQPLATYPPNPDAATSGPQTYPHHSAGQLSQRDVQHSQHWDEQPQYEYYPQHDQWHTELTSSPSSESTDATHYAYDPTVRSVSSYPAAAHPVTIVGAEESRHSEMRHPHPADFVGAPVEHPLYHSSSDWPSHSSPKNYQYAADEETQYFENGNLTISSHQMDVPQHHIAHAHTGQPFQDYVDPSSSQPPEYWKSGQSQEHESSADSRIAYQFAPGDVHSHQQQHGWTMTHHPYSAPMIREYYGHQGESQPALPPSIVTYATPYPAQHSGDIYASSNSVSGQTQTPSSHFADLSLSPVVHPDARTLSQDQSHQTVVPGNTVHPGAYHSPSSPDVPPPLSRAWFPTALSPASLSTANSQLSPLSSENGGHLALPPVVPSTNVVGTGLTSETHVRTQSAQRPRHPHRPQKIAPSLSMSTASSSSDDSTSTQQQRPGHLHIDSKAGGSIEEDVMAKFPYTPPSASAVTPGKRKRSGKEPHVACAFCRRRKIACVPGPSGDKDVGACMPCHKRELECVRPPLVRRGNNRRRNTPTEEAGGSESPLFPQQTTSIAHGSPVDHYHSEGSPQSSSGSGPSASPAAASEQTQPCDFCQGRQTECISGPSTSSTTFSCLNCQQHGLKCIRSIDLAPVNIGSGARAHF